MSDWLTYANQGATRNDPLAPQLVSALGSFLPELGVRMEVFSGGQEAAGEGGGRTGSTRHDHGNAADVFFYDTRTGRRLDWANPNDVPIFEEIVRRGHSAGITGFGAGEGYMQPGSMHLGFGAPAVWGAGGSGANAPDWLRTAYGAADTGASAPTDTSIAGAFGASTLPMEDWNHGAGGNALADLTTFGQGSSIRQPGQIEAPQRGNALAALSGAQDPAYGAAQGYGMGGGSATPQVPLSAPPALRPRVDATVQQILAAFAPRAVY